MQTGFTRLTGYFIYPISGRNRICSIRFAETIIASIMAMRQFINTPKSLEALISQFWPPNFRRKAVAIFLVSSGNHEKIQFILLILSEKNA